MRLTTATLQFPTSEKRPGSSKEQSSVTVATASRAAGRRRGQHIKETGEIDPPTSLCRCVCEKPRTIFIIIISVGGDMSKIERPGIYPPSLTHPCTSLRRVVCL